MDQKLVQLKSAIEEVVGIDNAIHGERSFELD
jgi:hypothetical protein